MYEKFGGLVNQKTRKVTFKLFLPDHEKAPFQYEGGGLPRITDEIRQQRQQDDSFVGSKFGKAIVGVDPLDARNLALLRGLVAAADAATARAT